MLKDKLANNDSRAPITASLAIKDVHLLKFDGNIKFDRGLK